MDLDIRSLTIGQVLAQKAQRNGDKPFLTFLPDGRVYSYRDIDRQSNRIARGLQALGLAKGRHVAVMMDNSPEQLLLYFALGKLGVITVPINTAARGGQLTHLISLSEAVAVFIDQGLRERFDEIAAELPAIEQLIVLGGGAQQAATTGRRVSDFAVLLEHSDAPVESDVRFNDLAFLMYTSGTTGPSKLNMFTHAHCLLYGWNNAKDHDYRETDVAYVCLPLFHISATFGVSYASLLANGRIVMTQRFSLSRFWSEVRDNRVTQLNALGAMSEFLWNQPPGPQDREHSVRLCRMVPVPRYAREFEERFGVTIVSGYGLSDFAQVTAFNAKEPKAKLGSAGRPRAHIDLRIVDDDDFDVPQGQPGEIVVRSNQPWGTSLGYYKMPEATLAAMRNQWFHTGDRGYLDPDGYLYFVNRKKDALRRRGENISAVEVEQVILKHPAVLDVAVYPVRAENPEDEVAATVVLKPDAKLSERELIEHCVHNMAYYMVPRFLQFAADLPRTFSHRVQKFKLTEAAQADLSKLFDREKAGIVLRGGKR
ncbi:MAG: AMP-binding protein [Rubrivivax sp.]